MQNNTENDKKPNHDVIITENEKLILPNDGINDDLNQIENRNVKPSLIKHVDVPNIIFLIFAYMLQGVPLGFLGSIPLILSSRKVSYSDQGTFSFASWPFTLKLLWAPIIDSVYSTRIGRRRSWIIPVELLFGILTISLANYVNKILDIERVRKSEDIYLLTAVFTLLVALSATHDVILDGWSIDLLSKENKAWQSICNSVGQFTGNFIGNAGFLLLESPDFCNDYIRHAFGLPRQKYGLINIKMFFYCFGSICIVSSIMILIFKSEHNSQVLELKRQQGETHEKTSLLHTIKLIWKLLRLRPMWKVIFILLTIRLGFAAENVIRIKLVSDGVAKEKITIIGIFISPLLIILPLVLSKYVNTPKPYNIVLRVFPIRLIAVLVFSTFTFLTPYLMYNDRSFPIYYYIIYFLLNTASSCFGFIMFTGNLSFFAQISDSKIGGTYITFLTIWSNFGSNAVKTSALFLTNLFTFKKCISMYNEMTSFGSNFTINFNLTNLTESISKNTCSSNKLTKECTEMNGYCVTEFDGFYLVTFISVSLGLLWLIFIRKTIKKLQSLPKSVWKVSNEPKNEI